MKFLSRGRVLRIKGSFKDAICIFSTPFLQIEMIVPESELTYFHRKDTAPCVMQGAVSVS